MASYNITLDPSTFTTMGGQGPCYCIALDTITPMLSGFSPGDTVNLGQLITDTFKSRLTPDAGAGQPYEYLTSHVEVNFSSTPMSDNYFGPSQFNFMYCEQTDIACQSYAAASSLTSDLFYTLPGSTIQLAWMGAYSYAPTPFESDLPPSWFLFISSLIMLILMRIKNR